MGRKNRRKRPNITKHLCIYGRLSRKSNSVAYCKTKDAYINKNYKSKGEMKIWKQISY